MDSIVIPARFNGPPGSANGGYTCGLVAGLLGADAAEVSLRSPPPLERALDVSRQADRITVSDGSTLVAEGYAAEVEVDAPAAVSVEDAEAASRAGYERWSARHPFPTCVVCGPEREAGDGFRIFPGPLSGGDGAFACVWTPQADHQAEVWAALDCPTSAPIANFGEGPPVVLARLAAKRLGAVSPGRPHVIVSWPLGIEGRKRHAGAALFGPDGAALAHARALWIELRASGSPV